MTRFLIIIMMLAILIGCGDGSSGHSGQDEDGDDDSGTDTGSDPDSDEDTSENESGPLEYSFEAWVPAISASITVKCHSGDYATVQAAINAAPDGGAVQVCAGTYQEHLTIDKSISLQGVGSVIIDGANIADEHLVHASGDHSITFENFQFTRGSSMFFHGSVDVTITHCAFYNYDTGDFYTYGGIIFGGGNTEDGYPSFAIIDTLFQSNRCNSLDSCISLRSSRATFDNVIFEQNAGYPSIINAYGMPLDISSSVFLSNRTDDDPDYDDDIDYYLYSAVLTVYNDEYHDVRSEVAINNTSFKKNRGDSASALFVDNSDVTVAGCVFSENTATKIGHTNSLNLHSTVLLSTDYGSDAEDSTLSSVNSTWSSNSPHDVATTNNYTFSAGSATSFNCRSPGTCM